MDGHRTRRQIADSILSDDDIRDDLLRVSVHPPEEPNRSYPDGMYRLVWSLLRSGGISVRMIDRSIKDPISQLVIEAVLTRGPSTVSDIARYVREAKGSSSRTTIRARLVDLEGRQVLRIAEEEHEWALSATFMRRVWGFCARVLGAREQLLPVRTYSGERATSDCGEVDPSPRLLSSP